LKGLNNEIRLRMIAYNAMRVASSCVRGSLQSRSIRVVKYGHSDGKQVFKCRDCGKKFREGLLKKTRYTPETITLTLDLYFSGLSLRK
jgi:transposase-like protein